MSLQEERLEEILSELRQVTERIADVALDLLHEAMANEDPKTSSAARAEKVVTRARRSVEKASHLLRSIELESD